MSSSHTEAPNFTAPSHHNTSPLQAVALFALRFYKAFLSAQLGGTCRFQPTCSQYAYEAVQHFGALRGCWLALKRLLRCHPLSRNFGYDPVPDSWVPICSARFPKRAPFQTTTPAPKPSVEEAHS
jgi:uncharacterized protein